ncbi:MAG: DUF2141 domain-containing protein [bacterium]
MKRDVEILKKVLKMNLNKVDEGFMMTKGHVYIKGAGLLKGVSTITTMVFITMVFIVISSSIFFSPVGSALEAGGQGQGDIEVTITHFHNNTGEVRVFLYDSKDGFPDKSEKAFQTISNKIENGESKIRFTHIPFGVYAISIIHDENSNGKLDKKLWAIPKEGYGASNNPKPRFGPPRFEDSRFEINAEKVDLCIQVYYL